MNADIHSHLVHGVDDGARTLEESLEAIDALARAGVGHVLTTPHLDASLIARPGLFDRNHGRVEERWAEVVEAARSAHPEMTFHLGREIMLDQFSLNSLDDRVRLGGTRYVLVEFPVHGVPPRSDEALARIGGHGSVPIVAHVERYYVLRKRPRVIEGWRDAGARLQVNAGSFVGAYGKAAESHAWKLLSRGWIDLVASDYHGRGPVWLTEAREMVGKKVGHAHERLLFEVNPNRVLSDERLEPVPAIPGEEVRGRSWLRRLGDRFRLR